MVFYAVGFGKCAAWISWIFDAHTKEKDDMRFDMCYSELGVEMTFCMMNLSFSART